MKREAVIAGALLVMLSPVGACAGDDSEDDAQDPGSGQTATTEGLSRAEVIQQGDAICAEFRKRRAEIERASERTSDLDEQAELVRELSDEAVSVAAQLDKLAVPSEDEAVIDNYLTLAREQIVLVRRTAGALEAGDVDKATALAESGQETAARMRDIAQGYGFKVCSSAEG
jgi:hypothetical protein